MARGFESALDRVFRSRRSESVPREWPRRQQQQFCGMEAPIVIVDQLPQRDRE